MPGRLFSEFVKRLPSGDMEMSMDAELKTTLICGDMRTTFQGLDAKEYPILPQLREATPVKIPQKALKDLIRQSVFAVSADESRPILTGALLEMEENVIDMVALDNYRLAVRVEHLDMSLPKQSVVIPGSSLNEMVHLLEEGNEVSLRISKNYMAVEFKGGRVLTRLLEGEFFKYRQILPKEAHTRVKVSVRELSNAIDRAALLARENKNNLVRFSLKGEELSITANAEVGQFLETLRVYVEGKDIDIAFNAKYMVDALKNVESEDVYLNFTTSVSPCVLKPVQGDTFLYLILPVRVMN
jgi:DNA polymerase-3 subunit beta